MINDTILFLPSLEDNRIMEIKKLSKKEMEDFIFDYSAKVILLRSTIDKLIDLPADLNSLKQKGHNAVYLTNVVDIHNIACDNLYLSVIEKTKSLIDITVDNHKCKRPIFLDFGSNTIAVSTTAYGRKEGFINCQWGPELYDSLTGIQEMIDKYEYNHLLYAD